MGVFTYQNDNTSTVAPAKLYKALVIDSDDLIPKVLEPIKSIEIVEGNGGAGTLKKITFVDEGGETKYMLQQVEVMDEGSYVYNYSIVGGSGLAETVEKITFEQKLEEGENGGSVGKVTITYFTKTDAPPTDEEVTKGKAKGDGLFRAIEAYVLANP